MSFFQNNVLRKYADNVDKELIAAKYELYKEYFLNTAIQENIQASKEEQFQEGFLRELFVKILGYTLNPSPNYNLITEQKNETNSKKADGAILVNDSVVGVIELKDHKTTDLSKIVPQAFGYKNQNKNAIYVIISNFEKLRFYIDNSVDCIEFDLFHLKETDFTTLWLCLAYENISTNLPKKIKTESVSNEDSITNALYKDYSNFKRVLFADILQKNPCETVEEKVLLFKKTQKLLDRFLFIFFAEDSGLLAPNTMLRIISDWEKLKDLDEYQPLYNRIKKYFGWLNDGYKGKDFEVFAYNGGLFKTDEVLDNLIISDEILAIHTKKLAEYDYKSEVDVNILGHIFENSLTEIEEVTNELQNGVQANTSKRKKDGVFYTPQYITKYIVENTVGKLCTEKKAELGIQEEEYFADKNRQKATKTALKEKLDKYRDWLLQLTICDPACGSGAFLNAALNFLIAEHRLVDEMEAKVFGEGLVFSYYANSILENNLYGVDINEESVEIAKLSLWLRTAQPNRKLNSLNKNIKCGNSLISDSAVADKAFDWQKEFPQVFEKGGFDVVIGNPPYVHLESILETSLQLEKLDFSTYNKRGDLYCVFVEKGFQIAKQNGFVSYIMPNKWLQAGYGKELREFFLTKQLERLIDFGDIQIFDGATTYPCIFVAREKANFENNILISVLQSATAFDFCQNVMTTEEVFKSSDFDGNTWVVSSQKEKLLLEKLKKQNISLCDFIGGEAHYGIKPGCTRAFVIDEETKNKLVDENHNAENKIHPIVRGRNLRAYMIPQKDDLDYLILAEYGSYKYLAKEYPSIYNWLLQFEDDLKKRGQCIGSKATGDKPYTGSHHWLELDNCPTNEYLAEYEKPKIMYQKFQVKPCFVYDESGLYCNDSMWLIPTNCKSLLPILNSKFGWWLVSKYCSQIQGGYQLIWKYFGKIPIPKNLSDQLDEKADQMLSFNADLQQKRNRFHKRLNENLGVVKITGALEKFEELDFKAFVLELKKQKIKLTLVQQDEWEEYFTQYKQDCKEISSQIAKTDAEIDQMVYELYGLTEEEIKIVEGR